MKQTHILILLAAIFFFSASPALAQMPEPNNPEDLFEFYEAREFVSTDGDTLRYRIMVPDSFEPGKNYPLVLFLHGAGERGSDNQSQLVWGAHAFAEESFRNEHPAIVIAPQAPAESFWSDLTWLRGENAPWSGPSRPLALAHQVVQQYAGSYPIDPDRIYATGLSMGGFGTWDLITQHPDYYAAAMPICGGGNPELAYRLASFPVWTFHGALDTVVPPTLSRAMIDAIREAGGLPGYTEYPDMDHFSWVPAYEDRFALEWLFSQSRNN